MGWIGVDFDGTLAEQEWHGIDHVGPPVVLMCKRVREWLAQGKDVRIVTARMGATHVTEAEIKKPMEDFCLREFGKILSITDRKDFEMEQLWDDRAVGVMSDTGIKWIPPWG